VNTRNHCRYKVKTGYNAGRNAGRIAVLPVTGMALFHPGKEHGDVPEYDTSPCYEVGTLLVLWINLLLLPLWLRWFRHLRCIRLE